jgi:hypothetical protein
MIEQAKRRALAVCAIPLVSLGIVLGGYFVGAVGQDVSKDRATTAAEKLLAKLRAACESDPKLRGILLGQDEPQDGVLSLTGTIDRAEQGALIEAEAARLLEASPEWKVPMPRGVSAREMSVFPIRSDLLPKLRADFAKETALPGGNPSLFQQTRIDDLYFDAQGRVRVVAICINQLAYLAHQDPAEFPGEDPRAKIAQKIHERLKSYPLPKKVDRNIMARLLPDRIAFEPNPARLLQRFANEAKLNDMLFREAWFDAGGNLLVDGLLGSGAKEERARAADLLSRPEIVKAYARPTGESSTKPADVVAPMTGAPWRTALLAALQKRFADDRNSKGATSILQHCRIDGAVFVYPDKGSLTLRFDGVVLRDGDAPVSAIGPALRSESARAAVFPIPVSYNILPRLTTLPTPLRELRRKVMSTPALDGVRLDDLVFGPAGEATLVGRWLGPAQAEALDATLLPVLLEQTKSRVRGPLARKLIELPSDQVLRSLRAKLMTSPSETSLDRLFFRPAAVIGTQPEMVLTGAALATGMADTKAQLESWLKADDLAKDMGAAVVELTPRPKSLLTELRKLVARETSLDGVLVKSVSFDEENRLVLSGRQDHGGQALGAVSLVEKAAAAAWKGLPPPKAARAGTFAIFPLDTLLKSVSSKLQSYREADGVLLNRAYFNERSELVLAGRISSPRRDLRALEHRIESLIGDDPDIKLAPLSLAPEAVDAEETAKILGRGVESLAAGNLANFALDELDLAIFLGPSDSIAWYLRGAYYYVKADEALAKRDLGRAHTLEKLNPSQRRDRARMLERFQGQLRTTIEALMDAPR